MTHLTYFLSYVWGLLIFTVAVIISGDIVQSTESGAGCGDSWPKCEGSLVPAIENIHTAIEFIHRALTSVLSVGYLGLLAWSYLLFGRRQLVWRSVLFSAFVLLLEILIGAALVFFGWVEDDASWGRVIVDSLHVVNTLILLASLVLILFWASESENRSISKEYSRGRFLIAAIGIVMVITITGTINSLADTLYFSDQVVVEETPIAQLLVSVRAVHPLVAIIGAFLIVGSIYMVMEDPKVTYSGLGFGIFGILFLQIIVGILNIALLTPVETQIIHLSLADALWVLLIFFSLYNYSSEKPRTT